jgi:hypothetical protein
VAKEKRRRSKFVASGRSAVALLRSTGRRVKLSSLHLPVALHPSRQQPIALPITPQTVELNAEHADDAGATTEQSALHREVRALRSRLAVAERRNARLRQALQRERLAAARAGSILLQPRPLINHLVADLSDVDFTDKDAVRLAISTVLGAYGFGATASESMPDPSPPAPATAPPSVPGLDRRAMLAIMRRLLDEQPEISSARYIQLPLDALSSQGELTLGQIANVTGMGSPLARRRLRLALEGLCRAGVTRLDGSRYCLVLATGTASGPT